MIPTFRLTGTMIPLILPRKLGSAYYIFLMRQFMRTIPDDLIGAARIEGCGEFGVLRRIMLPELPVEAPVWVSCSHENGFVWRGVTGASSYRIERSGSPDGAWEMIASAVEDAVITDVKSYEDSRASEPPLFRDTTQDRSAGCYYRVRAENSARVGAWVGGDAVHK